VVVPVPAASVARGVASPADISMDSSALERDMGLRMTPFAVGVHAALGLGLEGPATATD
jgi:hypothetical protein